MSEIDLVNAIRDVSVGAVNARSKPVSVQIGEYIGDSKVSLGTNIDVDVVIPRSILPCCNPTAETCVCPRSLDSENKTCNCPKRIKRGDRLLLVKQEGEYRYFVVAKI